MSMWAFLGSGEFEPWHDDIDRRLLAERPGPVLVAPTASAHEGAASYDAWASKGLAHYERLGAEVKLLPLRTRADAERDEVVAALDEAALVFFSGGNPWRLAEAVRGTPFWTTLSARLDEGGLAYAGCSAGVACLTEHTFDSDTDDMEQIFKPGIGHFRDLLFGPHWDMIDSWVPGATTFITGSVHEGQTLIGIDERTAMVGDGTDWEVVGASGVHIYRDGSWTAHASGDGFRLALDRSRVEPPASPVTG